MRYLTGVSFEMASLIRKLDFSAGALHELYSQQAFKFGDILAHRRLADTEPVCCRSEIPAFQHGKKYFDPVVLKHDTNIILLFVNFAFMKIGIMTAMDQEYEMVSKVLKSDSKHEIIPVHCGWGKVNSAVNAYKLISEHRPDCIISTGCAGGVAAGVYLLDVVVASQVAYHDCWYGEPNEYGQVQGFPARFEAAPFLLNAAKSLADSSVDDRQQARLHFGLIASGDRFVSGPEDNAFILKHFPDALACDMESGSISQVCHMAGVPFMSMRVISDTAEEENRLGQFENFWETVGSESFEILRAFIAAL